MGEQGLRLFSRFACAAALGVMLMAAPAQASSVHAKGFLVPGAPHRLIAGPGPRLTYTSMTCTNVSNLGCSFGPVHSLRPRTGEITSNTAAEGAFDLARASDRRVWFSAPLSNSIGSFPPDGGIDFLGGMGAGRTDCRWSYDNTPDNLCPSSEPQDITVAAGGNVWFSEIAGGRVGRIAPGGALTLWDTGAESRPQTIAAGPDGNVWFVVRTQTGPAALARITPTGEITRFPIGSRYMEDLISGPGGLLWGASGQGLFAFIPETGEIEKSFPRVRGSSVAVGPDGNLWLAANFCGAGDTQPMVTRVTPQGDATSFPVGSDSVASHECPGTGGIISRANHLWMADPGGTLWRLTPPR